MDQRFTDFVLCDKNLLLRVVHRTSTRHQGVEPLVNNLTTQTSTASILNKSNCYSAISLHVLYINRSKKKETDPDA
jgi:hypothetical protein